MLIVFVHGWSVLNTNTYGGLPAALVSNGAAAGLKLDVAHVHLGKYVSFADEVTMDDLARGFAQAIATEVSPQLADGEKFVCITHSTGGPLVRTWIALFYGREQKLDQCPLSHLIMLAPANHGSALAQLGKSRLSRMKFFLVEGVQPGVGVLNWLELGSDESWKLNTNWLGYDLVSVGIFPFVLTGQTIDHAFYDNLNAYTGEEGSDGVVRVAAANLNYGLLRLVQGDDGNMDLIKDDLAPPTACVVLPGRSHSGATIGIMASVAPNDDGSHPTVKWVLQCLQVGTPADYQKLAGDLAALTAQTQAEEQETTVTEFFLVKRTFCTNRYCMLVFRLMDDRGNDLTDYDVLFTAGPQYDPNHLPEGFFVDRQRNQNNPGKLTYYINHDVMVEGLQDPTREDKFGFQIIARPDKGFAYYKPLIYEGTLADLQDYFEPNQTLMVEIQLRRCVDKGVADLSLTLPAGPVIVNNQISDKPSGNLLD